MSAKILGAVWDLDLPTNKMIVLLAMADHADHNGENIYPSVELVAWKTGYSESQTRRIINALVKEGILSKEPRPGKTTLYSIHLEKGTQKAPFQKKSSNDTPSTAMTPPKNEGGSIAMTPQGSHGYDTPGGSIAMTPEPSFEPSVNHTTARADENGHDDSSGESSVVVDKPKKPDTPVQKVITLCEQNGIILSGLDLEYIKDALEHDTLDNITAAIEIAIGKKKRFWGYIQGILKKQWQERDAELEQQRQKKLQEAEIAAKLKAEGEQRRALVFGEGIPDDDAA